MRISKHRTVRGKPVAIVLNDKRSYYVCNDEIINLGFGWDNVEVSWDGAFRLITEYGVATSAALTCDNRCEKNFVSRELVMVDIDSGMRIEELENNEFYQEYGAGYYTTPSHTEEAHRFRIMFRTEEAITDALKMRQLFSALLHLYDAADISCKDATRIFYGTIGATRKEKTDKVLPLDVIELLIANTPHHQKTQTSKAHKLAKIAAPYVIGNQDHLSDMRILLDKLKQYYPELPYELRRDVTWAVTSNIGSTSIGEMRYRWSDDTLNGKYEDFVSAFDADRAPTPGTIYQMIRVYEPEFKIVHKYENIEEIRERLSKLN